MLRYMRKSKRGLFRRHSMGRFTNPRDLYFGEGARHEVKNLKGKKVAMTWALSLIHI